MKRVHTIWLGIGITLVIAGIIGCNMFDREHRNAPTEPSVEEPFSLMQRIEAMHPEWKARLDEFMSTWKDYQMPSALNATHGGWKDRFGYQVGSDQGITVKADFNLYHIDGEPYGTWYVSAKWVDTDGTSIVDEVFTAFTINDEGIGWALIPPEFLNGVFTVVNERYVADNSDTSAWNEPGSGLVLTVWAYEDDPTWDYYDFKKDLQNYSAKNGFGSIDERNMRKTILLNVSYGDNLVALVEALGRDWWPGLNPGLMFNVAVLVDLIDALTVEIQEEEEAGATPDACQQCVENLIAAGLCEGVPPEEQEFCNAFARFICFLEFGVCSPCVLIDFFCPLECEEAPDPVSCELECRFLWGLLIYFEFGVDCLGMCNNPANFCEEYCAIDDPEDPDCVADCTAELTALCTGEPLP